nr:DNA-3-methyladenine glycosylase I [uncultured Albidiferax sp.]
MNIPICRCTWADSSLLMATYHDEEWGVPERDSRKLWEKLVLDSFQAGLSWAIILRKREGFRAAFAQFDPVAVARFTPADVDRLMQDPGIVRSRAKIEATIGNAQAYLAMQTEGMDFSSWLWGMVGSAPIKGNGVVLTQSPLSADISKALKKRGFKFVGAVTIYAWMQAVGMVDDHSERCFRYQPG